MGQPVQKGKSRQQSGSVRIPYLLLIEAPLAKGALATEPAMAVFEADSRSHSPPTMAAALPL